MSDGEFEGYPNQDPDLNVVPKVQHRLEGQGRPPRVTGELPRIPGAVYYSEDELREQNERIQQQQRRETDSVSSQDDNLDAYQPPPDLSHLGIDVDQQLKDLTNQAFAQSRRGESQSVPPQGEPQAGKPDKDFLSRVKGASRQPRTDLSVDQANELMQLKLREQIALGDQNHYSEDEYHQQHQKQIRAEIEADRLNKLRPNVPEEPQDEPGFFGRIARRLRGNQ